MKKTTLLLAMLSVCAIQTVTAGPIQWLSQPSHNIQLTGSTITNQKTQQAILQALLKSKVITNVTTHSNAYRQLNIKLSNDPAHPGAWVFAMSPVFMKFQLWFLPMNSSHTKVTGALQKNPKHNMQNLNLATAPACPDNTTDALLFLPEYQASSLQPKPTDFMDAQQYEIAEAVKTKYPHSVILLGQQATKSAFLNYLTCPNLKFVMHVGSEMSDSDDGIYAGEAFYAGDGSYVTTTDIQQAMPSKSISQVVMAGCHFFSNNTSKAMCPVVSNILPDLQLYSGATSLPIVSGVATYNCFINNLNTQSGMTPSQTLSQCVNEYEPLAKNSTSKLIYIMNGIHSDPTKQPVLVTVTNNGHSTPLHAHDAMAIDTNKVTGNNTVNVDGKVLSECDAPSTTAQLSKPGIYVATQQYGPQGSSYCVENLENSEELPNAESPINGSGIIYGISTTSNKQQCMTIKTTFQAKINPGYTAPCTTVPNNLSFDMNLTYTKSKNPQIYAPVETAAKENNNTVDSATLHYSNGQTTIYSSDGKSTMPFGYFYSGQWSVGQISNVENLPQGCKLTIDQGSPLIVNLTGNGTIYLNLANTTKAKNLLK